MFLMDLKSYPACDQDYIGEMCTCKHYQFTGPLNCLDNKLLSKI